MRPRQINTSAAAITSGTISGVTALSTTGAVGIGTASPTGSLDVSAIATNPGTVAVTGSTVTGTSTTFTKTFKPGDSITTATTSGSETKEIQTIASNTAMTTVSAFAGTSTAAAYTSSLTGAQFVIYPSGGIKAMGTIGLSANNVADWIYKGDTVNITGTQLFATIRDRTTYNQTTSATGSISAFAAGPNLNATGTGTFSTVRGFNSFPTVMATNTGNITNLVGCTAAPTIAAGATGTITNNYGVLVNGVNSSSTNTTTNQYGVSVQPTQAAGTLTSYAGLNAGSAPAAATNSSLLLLGTTTIPAGTFGIYVASSANNVCAGNISFGSTSAPTAKIHAAAGTAVAGTSPLKFTAGTSLTTPESGAVEFDGNNFFVTVGSTRYVMAKVLTGSATLDFPNTASGASSDLTITVVGAAESDPVDLGVPNSVVLPDSIFVAWVSAADTVTVRFDNTSGGAKNPVAGLFKVVVHKTT